MTVLENKGRTGVDYSLAFYLFLLLSLDRLPHHFFNESNAVSRMFWGVMNVTTITMTSLYRNHMILRSILI